MHEKIISIEEAGNFKQDESQWSSYDGYRIVTDKQEIFVGVSNGQSCCESFGTLASEDDLSKMVGAFLLGIKVTDTGLNAKMVEAGKSLDEGGIMFVDFNTTRGVFQLAAYNSHNGYYGHEGIVISRDLKETAAL